jgi:hypothetical protein
LFVLRAIPCLLLFAVITLAAPSEAVTLNYDFSQGMGTEFYFYNPTSQFALDETGEELRMTKAADGTDESLKLAKVVSHFLIGGNFDVSIDYRLNLPLNDGDQLGFQLYGQNFIFFNVRSNESWLGGDQYHTFLGPRNIQPIPAFPTTDKEGTLRFVRESNIISAYFKSPDSEEYTLIYSEVFDNIYVRFAMVLQNQPFSTSSLNVSFHNLRVEADSVLFRPIEPKSRAN